MIFTIREKKRKLTMFERIMEIFSSLERTARARGESEKNFFLDYFNLL